MPFTALLVSMQSLILKLTSSSVHICLNMEVYVYYHGQKKKKKVGLYSAYVCIFIIRLMWSVNLTAKSMFVFV